MKEQQASQPHDRLRPVPAERFAGQIHVFHLDAALRELRAEAHPAQNGHRQQTIFHRAPVTKVLFAFDAGGALANHSTHGLVTIHVLEGRMMMEADEQDHDLHASELLMLNPDILNPDIPHDVRAFQSSAMLSTVHMENKS